MLVGDLNTNLLYFEHNKKFQNFIKLMFQFGLVPATNKPTRITKDTISAIYHMMINTIINKKISNCNLHSRYIWPFLKLKAKLYTPKTQFLYKCIIDENMIKAL